MAHATMYNGDVQKCLQQPDAPTPERNRLQNMFLDDDFRKEFTMHAMSSDYLEMNHFILSPDKPDRKYPVAFDAKQRVADISPHNKSSLFRLIRSELGCFEDVAGMGSDVAIDVTFDGSIPGRTCGTGVRPIMPGEFEYILDVEIKPIMGDDYPCVLRKIKQRMHVLQLRSELIREKRRKYYQQHKKYSDDRVPTERICILLVEEFSSSTTTAAQLTQIFGKDAIRVVFLKDVISSLRGNSKEEKKSPTDSYSVTASKKGVGLFDVKGVTKGQAERIKKMLLHEKPKLAVSAAKRICVRTTARTDKP